MSEILEGDKAGAEAAGEEEGREGEGRNARGHVVTCAFPKRLRSGRCR
jgi:hypothetical protein